MTNELKDGWMDRRTNGGKVEVRCQRQVLLLGSFLFLFLLLLLLFLILLCSFRFISIRFWSNLSFVVTNKIQVSHSSSRILCVTYSARARDQRNAMFKLSVAPVTRPANVKTITSGKKEQTNCGKTKRNSVIITLYCQQF